MSEKTEEPTDYRLLLIRYLIHVGMCEGITFLSDHWVKDRWLERLVLTEADVVELRKLDSEIAE